MSAEGGQRWGRAAVVIVNPAAGGGRTRRLWPRILARLRALELDVEWRETTRRGEAADLARTAAAGGASLVVAVGGDGTANEVADGLCHDGTPTRAALGLVLTGRGRDCSRNFGLPRDPLAAVLRLVEGRDEAVDVGRLDAAGVPPRHFLGAAGFGFDAEVARRVSARGGTGTVPYVLGILGALGGHHPRVMTVAADGTHRPPAPLTSVVVANGAFYGGGMRMAPGAEPTDGQLDLVTLGNVGRLELLRWLPAVYRGTHLRNPKVGLERAREVRIGADAPVPVHVDGEAHGTTPATVRVLPGALRLRR